MERTLRSLRKTKRAENAAMEEERQYQTEEQRTAAKRPPITDTMEDFWRPIIQDDYSAIRQPTVDANNFELKPSLITMVQQHQFTGHPTEDPNEHLGRFLRMDNIVKLNGVIPGVIKLHLFPFSLRIQKSRREEKFSKFLDIFKKIEIDISFAKVISQMPLYGKFLKEVLGKKRKIAEDGIVNLTATCRAIIQQKLPANMKDPGSFTIPCSIGKYEFKKALCDSKASINLMPLSVV